MVVKEPGGVLLEPGYGKKVCNSDSKQFQQYPQNEQPPLYVLNQWTQKRPRHLPVEIQILAWDRYENVAGLNQLMGSNLPLW